MRKLYRTLTGAAVVVLGGLVACDDPLQVDNENNPDTERVLRRPTDVEQLVGDSYKTSHRATLGGETVFNFGANDALQPQLLVMGLESYSSNANFGMAVRAGLPRTFVNNQRGNPVQAGNARDFIIGE